MALFAVALQLVLSFGHVHPLAAREPVTVAASIAGGGAPSQNPPAGHHHDHDDDYCAICAVLAMLSGAQTASAPVIALPVALVAVEQPSAPETTLTESPHAAFRSRAPPQA